jgi:ammonia channel protein AmtB
LDAYIDCVGTAHDSWRWVRLAIPLELETMLTELSVSFFYSGLARRKSALSLIWLSIMSVAVVSFQWFFW